MTVPKLPPSERDFEVFFAIAFQSLSTRHVAELHHISQTRVRQLVTLVGDWVADNLPDWGEADLKKQVRLAQHIAANRLEHQYEQAMRFWDVECDPKHLRQATRIALAQARLGITAGRIYALAADVTAGPAAVGQTFLSAMHKPASQARSVSDEVGHVPPLPPTRSASEEPEHRNVGIGAAQCTTGCAESPLVHQSDILADQPAPPPTDYGLPTTAPLPEDCSPTRLHPATGDALSGDDDALTDSPETLIEQERQRRLTDVEGTALIERRLLTLIAAEGDANPDKVAQLNETLARVREHRVVAEVRLSRFAPGVQIEPLFVPSQFVRRASPTTIQEHEPVAWTSAAFAAEHPGNECYEMNHDHAESALPASTDDTDDLVTCSATNRAAPLSHGYNLTDPELSAES